MDEKLYQDILFEHYKYPKYRKTITHPTFSAGHYNPSCGDKVTIEGIIENNRITQIGFSGSGCVISQAATSMLTEICVGQSVDTLCTFTKSTITDMIGIPLGPTRLKCALLCLEVLQQGLADYRANQKQ